jgi:hypothetical protein
LLLAAILFTAYTAQPSDAAGIPANKVAASGSTVEKLNAEGDTLLLSETVKINNPTDLILGVTAECAIVTQVTNGANGETERAFGEVKVYVTIDGVPVPVAEDDTDEGRVVFCNRAQEQEWTDTATTAPGGGDDSDDELRQYLSSRNANGFNWMALNVGTEYPGTPAGSNIHEIKVWAEWTVDATAQGLASAAVGNRTLILEPVKAAHYEVVTDLG